jgi:biopolymer transport protein ExbD
MLDIKYKRKPDALLNMTPIIDIVFLLLIFFLLSTNFMTQEGINVKLPLAESTAPQTQEEITVYITHEGLVFLKNEQLSDTQLYTKLKSLIGDDQKRLVTVKADRQIVLNRVVKVMDIIKSAGAGRLCIATERDF